MRILICEDEPDIQVILGDFLTAEGYEVCIASTAAEGLRLFAEEEPDLVLLDLMLPDRDGWEVLQEIRRLSDLPVIMLTALGRVDDKVKALSSLKADDYITKPFELDEIKARIEAVLRRYKPQRRDYSIFIDDTRKTVWIREREISLSPKEYSLLKLLASKPEQVFSSEEILAQVWSQKGGYASIQDVQKYVYLLRKKIENDPAHPEILLTVRGFGYQLAV
ncbi:response regulator transcription factor [Candidatus Bipolaricaulota bacterium]|nr:response regulator transcription factor [Candidatus Bipolaricaulota bacterium]